MKYAKTLLCFAVAAIPMIAVADEPPMNNPCANIQWSGKFLSKYPRAPAACQTVDMKDGVKYAKFEGKVLDVNADSVKVAIVNVAGTPSGEVAWHTTADDDIMINNKMSKVADLKKGDGLEFWVQEGKFLISTSPGAHQLPITPLRGSGTT
jgi:hypothetical protein